MKEEKEGGGEGKSQKSNGEARSHLPPHTNHFSCSPHRRVLEDEGREGREEKKDGKQGRKKERIRKMKRQKERAKEKKAGRGFV